jgi:hypothetical protein
MTDTTSRTDVDQRAARVLAGTMNGWYLGVLRAARAFAEDLATDAPLRELPPEFERFDADDIEAAHDGIECALRGTWVVLDAEGMPGIDAEGFYRSASHPHDYCAIHLYGDDLKRHGITIAELADPLAHNRPLLGRTILAALDALNGQEF